MPSSRQAAIEVLAAALYESLGWETRYNPGRLSGPDIGYATYDPLPEGIVSGDSDNIEWLKAAQRTLIALLADPEKAAKVREALGPEPVEGAGFALAMALADNGIVDSHPTEQYQYVETLPILAALASRGYELRAVRATLGGDENTREVAVRLNATLAEAAASGVTLDNANRRDLARLSGATLGGDEPIHRAFGEPCNYAPVCGIPRAGHDKADHAWQR